MKWKLDKRGTLTISCEGRMTDFSGGKNPPPPWQERKDEIVSLVLEDGVTEVGGSAFEGCKKLKRVYLPGTVKRFHHNCFKNCVNLEQLISPKEIVYRFIGEELSLKSINQKTAVEMESGKTQEIVFGMSTFYGVPWAKKRWGDFYIKKETLYTCFSNKEELKIPEGVHAIHSFAFSDTNVRTLEFPKTMIRLEQFALSDTKIESVTLPKHLEYIGEYAFADSAVKKVWFDVGVEHKEKAFKIESKAFARTVFPADVARGKRLPEGYKVDVGNANKIYDYYKKLCIKEKPLKTAWRAEGRARFGVVSLNGENSIYRRLQRGAAIFKIRYDEKEKKLLNVSSWHLDPWDSYMYEAYMGEPYYEDDQYLELYTKELWYFRSKSPLEEAFSIRSVWEEWDENGQFRRLDGDVCEEWFCAPGYYGNLKTPEKDLIVRWLKVHPEYTI